MSATVESEAPGQELEPRERALDPIEQWMADHEEFTYKVLDDGRRVAIINQELTKHAIVAAPVSSVIQVDRNWSPQLRSMRVRVGVNSFKVGSIRLDGGYEDVHDLDAPTWANLGELCGIERVRSDTRRFHGGMEVTVTARKRRPDGTWEYTKASREAEYDVEAELLEIDIIEKWEKYGRPNGKPRPTPLDIRKQVLRQRVFLFPSIQTKAFSRCVKALTGLRSFRRSELEQKPIIGIAWLLTPDLDDAGSRELVRLNYAESVSDLYGGEDLPQLEQSAAWVSSGGDIGDIESAVSGEVVEPARAGVPVEEWKVEEDESPQQPNGDGQEAKQWPKPTSTIQFANGPYEGKSIEEIAASQEGQKWLAQQHAKLRSDEKKQQLYDWLSWSLKRSITDENIADIVAAE